MSDQPESRTAPGLQYVPLLVPVIVIDVIAWTFFHRNDVPECTDSEVSKTINSMMFMARIDARTSSMNAILGKADIPAARVKSVTNIGLAKETGVRGCVANMSMEGEETPYAFTIAKSTKDGEGFEVVGADPTIVKARYGQLDKEGNFLNRAAPIGRSELERAFREGVDTMNAGQNAYGAGLRDRLSAAEPARLSRQSANRTREIAEIEPVAECKQVTQVLAYRCRLLIERNDALMSVFGGSSSTILDAEFEFKRDNATAPWHVTDAFKEEFMKAISGARLDSLKRSL